eukprot:scaffold178221_cov32-Tisochrysis_lutea.AAC.8
MLLYPLLYSANTPVAIMGGSFRLGSREVRGGSRRLRQTLIVGQWQWPLVTSPRPKCAMAMVRLDLDGRWKLEGVTSAYLFLTSTPERLVFIKNRKHSLFS